MKKMMQIGYGYWGHNVARKLSESKSFSFDYLAEVDENKRGAAVGQVSPATKIIGDYKSALDKVDAVAICTQTEYSHQIAIDAMEAGKHVFIEKPLAKNLERAMVLAEKAKEKGIVLHCDHLMVYNPCVRKIKEMIVGGELGDIMYIDISRVNLGPIRKDINALLDLAVHDIAVVDFFLGTLKPKHLNAVGTKFHGDRETITYLTMKSGKTLVNINSSWVSPVKIRRTVVAGTKKMVIFDDIKADHKLSVFDCGIDIVQGETYGTYEYQTRVGDVYLPNIEQSDSLQNSLEHFASCIESGEPSLSGPEQSLRVMEILDASLKMMTE